MLYYVYCWSFFLFQQWRWQLSALKSFSFVKSVKIKWTTNITRFPQKNIMNAEIIAKHVDMYSFIKLHGNLNLKYKITKHADWKRSSEFWNVLGKYKNYFMWYDCQWTYKNKRQKQTIIRLTKWETNKANNTNNKQLWQTETNDYMRLDWQKYW